MHAAPRDMEHRRKRAQELVERAPGLVGLPLAVPSIPLLNPVVTPIIDGPVQTTPQATATQAAPSQTPATTQPSNPQSPTTTAPSDSNTPSNPQSGNGVNGSGDGSTPNGSNPESSSTSTPNPNISDSTPSSGSTPSDGSSLSSGTSSQNDSGLSASGAGQAFVSSSQTSSLADGSLHGTGTIQTAIPTFSSVLTGSTTGTNTGSETNTGSDPASPSGSVGAESTHHGLSSGVLAAITIICLLFGLALLLCCVRRRAIAARVRRRKEWFAGGATQDMAYVEKEGTAGTRSARSSFATSYDRGHVASTAPTFEITTTVHVDPPMVWTADLSGSIVTAPPASHSVESSSSDTIRNAPDRSSILSSSSGGSSRPPSQVAPYLVVPPPSASGAALPSPFYVRPFSPSETWTFPKPPKDDDSDRTASLIRNGSSSSFAQASGFFTIEDPEDPVEPANPFAEPENPFTEHTDSRPPSASSEGNSTELHFAPVEIIRRPFFPSMEDEMAVAIGDEVRVTRRFDDGWAVAENVRTGIQGLIPIDCMRAIEEDLPEFLAKKRITSYMGPRESIITRNSIISGSSSIGAAM